MITPDPPPHTGKLPTTLVAYTYVTPAERHGKILPGYYYRCRVPIKGKRVCVQFRR